MKKLLLALAASVLLPASAYAGQVAYNYSGLSYDLRDNSPRWEISGSFIFEKSDVVAGEDLIEKIVSWDFSWTNGPVTIALSSTTDGAFISNDPNSYDPAIGGPVFKVDDSLEIELLAFEGLVEGRFPLVSFEFNGGRFNFTPSANGCCSQGDGAFTGPELLPESVEVDIKPSSDTSCNAVVPVAVLGSDTFDAMLIDADTLTFVGASARQTGNGTLSCHVSDVNDDGYMDLLCQYKNATAEGALSGSLYDGTPILGSDVYCVSP